MNSRLWLGLALGMGASVIWGAHAVVARISLAGQGLHPFDLIACRFLVSGLILAPLVWRERAALIRLGLPKLLVLTAMGGVGNLMVFTTALLYAPASHGGTIPPITGPIMGALAGYLLLGENPTRGRVSALGLMLLGVLFIGWDGLSTDAPDVWKGDILLFLAGVSWGFFGALLRRWQAPAFPTASAMAIVSAIIILPLWVGTSAADFLARPAWLQLWVGFAQGIMLGVVSMQMFTRSLEILGPTRAATLSVMVPVTALLLSATVLGEPIGAKQVLGAVLAILGMLGAVTLTGNARVRGG